jgi:hypothetical protein
MLFSTLSITGCSSARVNHETENGKPNAGRFGILEIKLTIEGKLINSPADALFQMSTYMLKWRVLVRPKDRGLLDATLGEIRKLQVRLRNDG